MDGAFTFQKLETFRSRSRSGLLFASSESLTPSCSVLGLSLIDHYTTLADTSRQTMAPVTAQLSHSTAQLGIVRLVIAAAAIPTRPHDANNRRCLTDLRGKERRRFAFIFLQASSSAKPCAPMATTGYKLTRQKIPKPQPLSSDQTSNCVPLSGEASGCSAA